MKYTIVSIDKEVDYSKVLVDNFATTRKSNDGLFMLLKYEETPDFITETEYTEEEILALMQTEIWQPILGGVYGTN